MGNNNQTRIRPLINQNDFEAINFKLNNFIKRKKSAFMNSKPKLNELIHNGNINDIVKILIQVIDLNINRYANNNIYNGMLLEPSFTYQNGQSVKLEERERENNKDELFKSKYTKNTIENINKILGLKNGQNLKLFWAINNKRELHNQLGDSLSSFSNRQLNKYVNDSFMSNLTNRSFERKMKNKDYYKLNFLTINPINKVKNPQTSRSIIYGTKIKYPFGKIKNNFYNNNNCIMQNLPTLSNIDKKSISSDEDNNLSVSWLRKEDSRIHKSLNYQNIEKNRKELRNYSQEKVFLKEEIKKPKGQNDKNEKATKKNNINSNRNNKSKKINNKNKSPNFCNINIKTKQGRHKNLDIKNINNINNLIKNISTSKTPTDKSIKEINLNLFKTKSNKFRKEKSSDIEERNIFNNNSDKITSNNNGINNNIINANINNLMNNNNTKNNTNIHISNGNNVNNLNANNNISNMNIINNDFKITSANKYINKAIINKQNKISQEKNQKKLKSKSNEKKGIFSKISSYSTTRGNKDFPIKKKSLPVSRLINKKSYIDTNFVYDLNKNTSKKISKGFKKQTIFTNCNFFLKIDSLKNNIRDNINHNCKENNTNTNPTMNIILQKEKLIEEKIDFKIDLKSLISEGKAKNNSNITKNKRDKNNIMKINESIDVENEKSKFVYDNFIESLNKYLGFKNELLVQKKDLRKLINYNKYSYLKKNYDKNNNSKNNNLLLKSKYNNYKAQVFENNLNNKDNNFINENQINNVEDYNNNIEQVDNNCSVQSINNNNNLNQNENNHNINIEGTQYKNEINQDIYNNYDNNNCFIQVPTQIDYMNNQIYRNNNCNESFNRQSKNNMSNMQINEQNINTNNIYNNQLNDSGNERNLIFGNNKNGINYVEQKYLQNEDNNNQNFEHSNINNYNLSSFNAYNLNSLDYINSNQINNNVNENYLPIKNQQTSTNNIFSESSEKYYSIRSVSAND